MEPITRTQLQNAHAAAFAERERRARREQELKGQLAAEKFYKEIRRVAEAGERTFALSDPMEPGIAFNTMYTWIVEHFPDCTITWSAYAIRVDWSVAMGDKRLIELEERRLEKETSW